MEERKERKWSTKKTNTGATAFRFEHRVTVLAKTRTAIYFIGIVTAVSFRKGYIN
jgi:hypothetical protein